MSGLLMVLTESSRIPSCCHENKYLNRKKEKKKLSIISVVCLFLLYFCYLGCGGRTNSFPLYSQVVYFLVPTWQIYCKETPHIYYR